MNKLILAARSASLNSHSPYSKFKVGAAVRAKSGQIYLGTNIENASYGLTVCAERAAIFSAISNGEKEIVEIGISCQADGDSSSSMMPCGACRQVIREFADGNAMVHVDHVGAFELDQLLPQPFYLK